MRSLPRHLLLCLALSLALPCAARDVTFISTSDCHYREPDHKAGNHNDLNRASVEEMNRATKLSWPAQLGGPTKHEWGGEWEWRLPFERKLK